MMKTYRIPDLLPYIDWTYFYYAWGVKEGQPEAAEVRAEAERLLHHLSLNGVVVRAACKDLPAWSEGDDIVTPEGRLCFLRQQHAHADRPSLCMADYIAPEGYADAAHVADHIVLFATTVSASHECPCCVGDPLLLQTAKDRLAEAAAERLHREEFGGRGIRPAVGYPSMPDQSLIIDIASHLPFKEMGIQLTENCMMLPHASTCGLILFHPAATYFAVGRVDDDQLADYARRRQLSTTYLRKYLPQ